MEHLAILRKKGNFLGKILSGEKTIESRWYSNRKAPWKSIREGDVVYFKESGEPVVAKADVSKVLFFDKLTQRSVKNILAKYGRRICISPSRFKEFSSKNYCILVFLENAKEVAPFNIDKSGFGLMSAWISVKNIKEIKD